MSLPETRLDHVAITVADLERSIAFYTDMLGCTVAGQLLLDDGDFKIVYLRSGDAVVELFAFRGSEARTRTDASDREGGFKHLAFTTSDVDALAARLRAADVPFTLHPMDAKGNVRIAFFRDPDGNLLEIVSGFPDVEPYRTGWA